MSNTLINQGVSDTWSSYDSSNKTLSEILFVNKLIKDTRIDFFFIYARRNVLSTKDSSVTFE